MKYLNIALPKGRLAKSLAAFFERANLLEDTRKLIITDEESLIKFYLVKPSDVPIYVEYGAADLGICGRDTLLEQGRDLYEVLDLGIGKCRMCVAGPVGLKDKFDKMPHKRIATNFPNIARNYFEHVKNESVEIINLSGSVEIAPLVGLSELIVDIVESGKTLKENDLEVYETITDISARLIVNRVSMKIERLRISKIIDAIREVANENI